MSKISYFIEFFRQKIKKKEIKRLKIQFVIGEYNHRSLISIEAPQK